MNRIVQKQNETTSHLMQLFFDLDGTLLDSRLRLYRLFQELVPEAGFSFKNYWQLKRDYNHAEILRKYFNYKPEDRSHFEYLWMQKIEDEELLHLDKPYSGVPEYLGALKAKGCDLFVITGRKLRDRTVKQISAWGWVNFFKQVLVTEQKCSKADLVKPCIKQGKMNWIVGDTQQEILLGKELNMATVAVLSGFSSEKKLKTYSPDRIVNSVVDFYPF